jgi:hypothetical protein
VLEAAAHQQESQQQQQQFPVQRQPMPRRSSRPRARAAGGQPGWKSCTGRHGPDRRAIGIGSASRQQRRPRKRSRPQIGYPLELRRVLVRDVKQRDSRAVARRRSRGAAQRPRIQLIIGLWAAGSRHLPSRRATANKFVVTANKEVMAASSELLARRQRRLLYEASVGGGT